MDSFASPCEVEDLLRHEAWIRGLVRRLVAAHEVDDVVQQTWIAALEQPRRPGSLRAFLASVARRRVARLRRSAARRRERERRAARSEELPSTEVMLDRVQTEREVAVLVAELEEPFRTAILLRYFEGLEPLEIARRQGVPAATVRTRVHRGLERIRQRLRARHGRDWRVAMTALFFGIPERVAAGALPVPLLSGGLALVGTHKMIAAAVAVVLLACFVWLAIPPAAGLTAVDVGPGERAGELASQGGGASPRAPTEAALVRSEVSAPAAEEVVTQTRGRVLDATGGPLGAVPLEFVGFDPVEQEVGEQLELREPVRTDALGVFELPRPEGGFVVRAGSGFVTLRATVVAGPEVDTADLLVVAAPRAQLRGRVTDQAGTPLAGVRLQGQALFLPDFPEPLDRTQDCLRLELETDENGGFVLADAPATDAVVYSFSKPGYLGCRHRYGEAANGWLSVTMRRSSAGGHPIRGQVIDRHGRLVAGADVRLGREQQTRSSALGEFELAWPRRPGQLIATVRGYQPAVRAGVGEGPLEDLVVLQLGAPTLAIEGVVRHADDRPAAGLLVNLVDPTPAGVGKVAELLAAPTDPGLGYHALARTDGAGRFAVGGLLDRPYRLRFFDEDSLLNLQTEPIAAGSVDVEITIPADALIAELSGRVVDSALRPVPGAAVKLHLTVSQVMGISLGAAGAETLTDAEGRFVLENVPRQHVALAVTGEDIVESYQKVDTLDLQSPLQVRVYRRCHVRIEVPPGTSPGLKIRFETAEGRPVAVQSIGASRTFSTHAWTMREDRSPVLSLPENASQMIWYRDGGELGRSAVHLDPTPGRIQVLAPGF